MASSQVLQGTAAIAREHRNVGPDSPRLTELRRDLAAAKLEDYIKRTVNGAPPLTAEQRARIAALLTSGDAA